MHLHVHVKVQISFFPLIRVRGKFSFFNGGFTENAKKLLTVAKAKEQGEQREQRDIA